MVHRISYDKRLLKTLEDHLGSRPVSGFFGQVGLMDHQPEVLSEAAVIYHVGRGIAWAEEPFHMATDVHTLLWGKPRPEVMREACRDAQAFLLCELFATIPLNSRLNQWLPAWGFAYSDKLMVDYDGVEYEMVEYQWRDA